MTHSFLVMFIYIHWKGLMTETLNHYLFWGKLSQFNFELRQSTYQYSGHLSYIQGLLLIQGLGYQEGRASLGLPEGTQSKIS